MKLKSEWEKYRKWLKKVSPQQFELLNAGADQAQIELLKKHFPFLLPEEFIQLYALNNGQMDFPYRGSVFMCMTFLGIPNIIAQYDISKELSTQELNYGETFGDYYNYEKEGGTSYPTNAIKIKYINLKWIPIWHDGGGNHIGIDLDPDEKGVYGQVINFGRDQNKKFVIANSLTLFFKLINLKIKQNKVQVVHGKDCGFGPEANYYLMDLGDPTQSNIIENLRNETMLK
jgi:cell wall assembly regulator SMI1